MAGLGALDHLNIFDRGGVSPVVTGPGIRLFAARTPQIGMTNIMVVGNCDRWDVANDIPEISAELEPMGIVVAMVVDLVPGKEKQVGVELSDVFNDVGLGYVPAD
jgi:hypothetical protein